jgi:hypothetical protein
MERVESRITPRFFTEGERGNPLPFSRRLHTHSEGEAKINTRKGLKHISEGIKIAP